MIPQFQMLSPGFFPVILLIPGKECPGESHILFIRCRMIPPEVQSRKGSALFRPVFGEINQKDHGVLLPAVHRRTDPDLFADRRPFQSILFAGEYFKCGEIPPGRNHAEEFFFVQKTDFLPAEIHPFRRRADAPGCTGMIQRRRQGIRRHFFLVIKNIGQNFFPFSHKDRSFI